MTVGEVLQVQNSMSHTCIPTAVLNCAHFMYQTVTKQGNNEYRFDVLYKPHIVNEPAE